MIRSVQSRVARVGQQYIILKILYLVYGRKGMLGYMAKTPTFTSLILRMTEGRHLCDGSTHSSGCMAAF